MPPLVSVIIPTWNRASLLVEAVNSVLQQTEKRIEVLVCDDGSTDDSRRLVEALGDPRVKWIDGPRFGRPAPARNRGIAVARGKWVAFLDSDDTWHPLKLEMQIRVLQSSGLRACSTNAERMISAGTQNVGPLLNYQKNEISLAEIVGTNWVVCSSMLLDRAILSEAGGFPEGPEFKAIEDYALWVKVAALTPIVYLSECYVRYRDEPSTSIRSDSHQQKGRLRRMVLGEFLVWLKSQTKKPPFLDLLRIRLLWLQARFGLEPGDRLHLVR